MRRDQEMEFSWHPAIIIVIIIVLPKLPWVHIECIFVAMSWFSYKSFFFSVPDIVVECLKDVVSEPQQGSKKFKLLCCAVLKEIAPTPQIVINNFDPPVDQQSIPILLPLVLTQVWIGDFRYSGWVIIHKAIEDKALGKQWIFLMIFFYFPEPRVQLFCVWLLNQNIKNEL